MHGPGFHKDAADYAGSSHQRPPYAAYAVASAEEGSCAREPNYGSEDDDLGVPVADQHPLLKAAVARAERPGGHRYEGGPVTAAVTSSGVLMAPISTW